jgi:hypothetical protein
MRAVTGAVLCCVELVKLAKVLHDLSPLQSVAVLGMDGRPRSYEKRPFAADFKNNPLGELMARAPTEASTFQDVQGGERRPLSVFLHPTYPHAPTRCGRQSPSPVPAVLPRPPEGSARACVGHDTPVS